ncbi:MAG: hypothetical protein LBK75_08415 [Oscillospiraceae bacterium]|nr:hypothetical protein [Oscillospiraceae bacterium]
MNCMDCATIVATFAGALGCRVSEKRMGSGFACNPIIAIGYDVWKPPFNGSFSYHEVSVSEPLDTETALVPKENNYRVYDACLHLDGSEAPGIAGSEIKLLPAGMIFSKFSDPIAAGREIPLCESYREHLATNDDEGVKKCKYSLDYNSNFNNIYKTVI